MELVMVFTVGDFAGGMGGALVDAVNALTCFAPRGGVKVKEDAGNLVLILMFVWVSVIVTVCSPIVCTKVI